MRPVFLAFCSLLTLSLPAQTTKLDQLLPDLLQKADIPGMSIAVLDNGKVTYQGALGVKSTDNGMPVDDKTVFAAASLSKPVFAYGLLQLVDAGQLDLDKPLYTYLPYADIAHDERYKKITARMLLSHSGGFPNWRNDSLRILFTPGEHFSYSGEGFVYLQKVMEKITGQPMEEWMQTHVFQPLGMTHTGYVWRDGFEENFAQPHDDNQRSQQKYKPEESNAAHSLQTTASDYARFLQALFSGKDLKKSTLQQMLKPQIPTGTSFQDRQNRHDRLAWGLGWGLDESPDGRVFWHWGDNGTFKCFIAARPAQGDAVVYFTNSSNGLTIVQDVLAASPIGPMPPLTTWLDYGSYNSPSRQLKRAIVEKGFHEAIAPFRGQSSLPFDTARLGESDMNRLGYDLMRAHHLDEALRVFAANVQAFPNSSNVYDSYGEALLRAGHREEAGRQYAEAARRNPENEVAAHMATHLTQPMTGNTTFRLQGYPNARFVSLAGSFNDWREWKHVMRWENGAWLAHLDLAPGTYRYKFVVDGVWILDPGNPDSEYEGNHNSVIKIDRD